MVQFTDAEEERLRAALRMIGEETGRAEESEKPPALPNRVIWWRRRGAAGGLLAAAAAAAIGLGIALDGDDSGGRSGTGGDAKLSTEGWIACSQAMVEGDVVSVREAPQPGRVILTLTVTDWLKPDTGKKQADFNVVDPERDGAYKRWKPGERLLIVISQERDEHVTAYGPDAYITSHGGPDIAEVRARIEKAMPKAVGMTCTDGGRGDI
ncbi:hypothetical protein [Streptomyces jumonjinensis]|uniref:Uncharacterized protein n=1 Tax=Streptomyces jumonjinensis TaxID=1945 RepID=A0A646KSA4_STRJU|nr:hypothetical protein [Streptomyces jumonjinensis]MQT05204.1 hypothetical protein [Streptomyces jumonjinensis]